MKTLARRAWLLAAVLAAAAALVARPPAADARPRKSYWMVSFLGGALLPVRETADQRDLGLGVGLKVGFTSKYGFGVALSAQYSPLPVADPAEGADADDVVENHFVSGAVTPRFTIGRGALRLTLAAGGGFMTERTTSRAAADGEESARRTDSVLAGAGVGELGLETYLWDSGGLVVTGSYLRAFGESESEIASVLGGLVFTFR